MFTTHSNFVLTGSITRYPRRSTYIVGIAVAMLTALSSACDRVPREATTDSLLNRDLTLATASSASPYIPGLSDTAIVEPTTVPRSRIESSANASEKVGKTPVQKPKVPTKASSTPPKSAPTPTPKPTETTVASVPRTPPPSAPAGAVGAAGAVGGSGSDTLANAGATGNAPRPGIGRRAIGVGARLVTRTNAELCSVANRPGDRVVATLDADVVSSDGGRLAAGTPVLVELSAPATEGDFAFRVKAVQVNGVLIPVEGTVAVAGETTERKISKGGDKGKVIGGAIAGAILGRVLGGGAKGTIIGAAGGAAAGTAAAARNTITEKCLPAGAIVTVTLTAPLVLAQGVP